MTKKVNSYKFVSGITKRLVKTWIDRQEHRPIPWTPLSKPLSECTVAILSSGGMALKGDLPFDQEGERKNPWWGDTSYRLIPQGATEKDIEIYHLHIDPTYAKKDINCLLPIGRLAELESVGEIGKSARRHYTTMGYTPQPEALIKESIPRIIQNMREDDVEVVLLVPA